MFLDGERAKVISRRIHMRMGSLWVDATTGEQVRISAGRLYPAIRQELRPEPRHSAVGFRFRKKPTSTSTP